MVVSEPNHNGKKERQDVIFNAACRVIREKGYHQARIADIAQEAGISYGLVYHYYKGKAHLFDAILDEWWSGLYSMLDSSISDDSSIEEKLGAVISYFLDQYDARPNLVHIFITQISRSSENLTPMRLSDFKRFMQKTETIIAKAQAEGVLRTDCKARYLTYVFLGAMETFLSAMVLENQPLKGKSQKLRIQEALLKLFLDGARSR